MSSVRAALMCLVVLWAGTSAHAQSAPDQPNAVKARAFIAQLLKQDFAGAVSSFDAAMTAALPEAKLREFWTGVIARAGAFQRYEDQKVERRGAYEAVVLLTAFQNVRANITVVYNSAGQIAGFNIQPAVQVSAPPAYANASAFTEREVTVGSGEWALPATLSMPSGNGPFPAVVLVHGSGPADRDETVGPNKPFRDLAHGLASQGIAVLRYEKRTRVHAPKLAAVHRPTVKDETIDDAATAVALAASMPSIARDRIFVLGHSLGAMLVPRIAAAAPQARGFIVMAGPARPLEQAMLEQVRYMAAIDGTTSAEEQALIDQMKTVFDAVHALQPADIDKKDPIGGVPASYWLDLRGYDAPQAAKAVAKPMLVLQGERDYQVTPAEFARWKASLGTRKDVAFKIYPGLNHLFMAGTGPGNPQEYATPGHVAEEVVRDIAAWIALWK